MDKLLPRGTSKFLFPLSSNFNQSVNAQTTNVEMHFIFSKGQRPIEGRRETILRKPVYALEGWKLTYK